MNWTLSGGILWCVAIVALQGCTVDATHTDGEDKEDIGAISSALNPPCDPAIYDSCTPEDDDWSGSVHTAIFVCKLQNSTVSPTGNFAGATCPVPTDYALIGGGAVVEGFAQPGALLEASYPLDKSQWLATSRDLAVPFPHQIRAWAVGLRLNGLSGPALRNIVTYTDVTTPSAQPTSGFAFVPSGHVLVGGGVIAPFGQRITHSFPLPPNAGGWLGAFGNPVFSNPGSGLIRAISLPSCLPQLGSCTSPPVPSQFRLTNQMFSNPSPSNGAGYRVAAVGKPDPAAVMTAVGGTTSSTNPGRFLTQLIPTQTGAVAVNKDHAVVDNAGATAFGVSLKRL